MTTIVSLTRPFFLPKSLFTMTAMTISLLICMLAVQSANARTNQSIRKHLAFEQLEERRPRRL